MKFGIDYGHNCPPDTGAKGIKQEDVLTKDIGNRVIQKLKALGNQVVLCVPNSCSSVTNSLQQRCNIANSNIVDLFVSIHFNSFNKQAHGTEVFAISDRGIRFARPVLASIVNLGFFNRGVKDGSHLYVLKNTNMPSILIECCFCDSQKDMNLYNPETMANAIVKGLTGLNPPQTDSPGNDKDTRIVELQKALNRLKITDANGKALVEDGVVGPATTSAIKKFQSIMNIQTTGVAGNETWDLINLIFSKPILRPNHAGGAVVRYVQSRVGAAVDGIYGPMSADAVERFQRKNGLTADGIVGPNTWEKLIG